ncbi:MAG: UvrD-helicase domain-containing protein [Xanthomonadales bacterium]
MTRPADWRQRERARDPAQSFIVQAPAGSGKTELLTQRMLGLLARVENPEEVVAITFTRKAAAEMAQRLLERLDAAGKPAPETLEPHLQLSRELARAVLANDAERGWNLLDQPSRLRIRTIDGLCADLARQLPVLSGLGGGQQVTEDAAPLYLQAATRTMAAIEDDDDPLRADVVRLLDRYDNRYDHLVELLTSMLASRDQWRHHLLALRDGDHFDRATLESTLGYLVESELAAARAAVPEKALAELPDLLRYALSNAPQDAAEVAALLEACGGPDTGHLALPANAAALPHWVTLIRRLLTADGARWRAGADAKAGFPPPSKARGEEKERRQYWKDAFGRLLDALRDDEALRARLAGVLRLPRPDYEDEAWDSLESMMRILLRSCAEWELVMADSGLADFSEIAGRAIRALGEEDRPSDLALRLDYRITHLLVDEFQDTSHSQITLLKRLTAGWTEGDGRTLFLVGDPMQSIYRFRKAEVSLFIRAFEGHLFDQLRLEPLRLEVNFRSARPIVDWVNRVFPSVMPHANDPVKGAVRYSPAAVRPNGSDDGAVGISLQAERDDDAEAERVVELLRERDPNARTAILVRARSHATAILQRLDRLKHDEPAFRYRAVDFNPLAETPLVRDLVSLTLALQQPADRLAWLSVLRAPFVGLDLDDLDRLVGGDAEGLIEDALAGATDLSEGGRRRLDRAAPVLLESAGLRGRAPIRTVVESCWQRLGGPACIDNASELDDAETFLALLERLEREALPVDRETLATHLADLYAEPDALAGAGLQVMTIYAAKGLEFDTVILPGINRDTGGDASRLMHWFELADIDRIVLSPMRNVAEKAAQRRSGDLIQFISGVERERQKLENGRLLYVAATRAIRELHLLGALQPNAKGECKPGAATLLGELWPAVAEDQEPGLLADWAASGGAGEAGPAPTPAPLPQRYRRLPAAWSPPPIPAGVTTPPAAAIEAREPIEFSWAGENARHAGELVHRLLQRIAETGLDSWATRGGFGAHADWCRRQLREAGITGREAEPVLKRVAQAVARCIDSADGRWILSPHAEAGCEVALTALFDGQPANLILDRTFVVDGVRWIIDYKTSTHAGGDLEGFLESEKARYRGQLERYRAALALTENRPIRTALYFPLLDRLVTLDGPQKPASA